MEKVEKTYRVKFLMNFEETMKFRRGSTVNKTLSFFLVKRSLVLVGNFDAAFLECYLPS